MNALTIQRRKSSRAISRAAARGFTLIELLMVMVILAILAAIVVPRIVTRGADAQIAAAKQDIHNLGDALKLFAVDNSRFPTTDEGLNALVSAPSGADHWNGKYVDAVPNDPWGHAYRYDAPGADGKDFDLSSDGPPGGQAISN